MGPDELYTLRAQYWLGHYDLCLDECRSVARRPMPPSLKEERQEFVVRCYLAKGEAERAEQECEGGEAGHGIEALKIRAQYDRVSASGADTATEALVDAMKSLVANPESATGQVQLYASHLFLAAGLTRDALQCVHLGTTMEHLSQCLQIYLKIDRLDKAKETLDLMRQADEDSVLTQLGTVYVDVAGGRSTAPDATHHLNTLSEQYGSSLLLLNCSAVAAMTAGNYEGADGSLTEAVQEFNGEADADTLINSVVCATQMGKGPEVTDPLLEKLRAGHGKHPFVEGLVRVEGALEREAMKYKGEPIVA